MGTFTDTNFDRYSEQVYSDASVFSDWYKDAHGVRPHGLMTDKWYAFFAGMSDEARAAYMREQAESWQE